MIATALRSGRGVTAHSRPDDHQGRPLTKPPLRSERAPPVPGGGRQGLLRAPWGSPLRSARQPLRQASAPSQTPLGAGHPLP